MPYFGAFWATFGLITLGATLYHRLSIAGVIFGWGMVYVLFEFELLF